MSRSKLGFYLLVLALALVLTTFAGAIYLSTIAGKLEPALYARVASSGIFPVIPALGVVGVFLGIFGFELVSE